MVFKYRTYLSLPSLDHLNDGFKDTQHTCYLILSLFIYYIFVNIELWCYLYEDSRFSIERPRTNKKFEYCILNFSIFYIISFRSLRSTVSKLMWYGIGWYLKWSVISLDALYTVAYLKHAVLVLKHTVGGPLISKQTARQTQRPPSLEFVLFVANFTGSLPGIHSVPLRRKMISIQTLWTDKYFIKHIFGFQSKTQNVTMMIAIVIKITVWNFNS